MAELHRGDRLAVIPSLSETFGFTVAECVVNRIPFIAANAGGVPEVVDHVEGRRRWLFEPTAEGLRNALIERLGAPGEEEVELRGDVAAACDPKRWNDRVEAAYGEFPPRRPRSLRVRTTDPATVTVAISHDNHDGVLPVALASSAGSSPG